ncbi:MAG: class I SAM-dependent methyltransferase [Candidatus Micrarchaeota archaeon]
MAGWRVLGGRPESGKPRLPVPVSDTLAVIAEKGEKPTPLEFLGLVTEFAKERRKHNDAILEKEREIRASYECFESEKRAEFFSLLYDMFSEGYDEHMSKTGHYWAIKRVLEFAYPHLRLPMLDITAGTGEPLKYALEILDDLQVRGRLPEEPSSAHQIFANEISPKMVSLAERKLGGRAQFRKGNAYELPPEWRQKFATVLCSQTFHLISDEDKLRLVLAMKGALAPGGVAVVMEEDPFRISPTPQIEPVSIFLRSVVRPIKHRGDLIGLFEANGLTKLEERAAAPIDSEHVMRLHLFKLT